MVFTFTLKTIVAMMVMFGSRVNYENYFTLFYSKQMVIVELDF